MVKSYVNFKIAVKISVLQTKVKKKSLHLGSIMLNEKKQVLGDYSGMPFS